MMKDQIILLASRGMSHDTIATVVGCHPAYVRAALQRHRAAKVAAKEEKPRTMLRTVSIRDVDAKEEVVIRFLASRRRSPEYIAQVVNRPASEVATIIIQTR